jgi:hypothetical protein
MIKKICLAIEMGTVFGKQRKTSDEIAIEQYVDRLLQNSAVNNACIPDQFERRMYISLLQVLVGNIKQACDTFELKLLNYKITVHIEPDQPVGNQ